jgi:hypothetical protein
MPLRYNQGQQKLVCRPRLVAGAPGPIAAGIAQNASRVEQRRTDRALNTAPAIA